MSKFIFLFHVLLRRSCCYCIVLQRDGTERGLEPALVIVFVLTKPRTVGDCVLCVCRYIYVCMRVCVLNECFSFFSLSLPLMLSLSLFRKLPPPSLLLYIYTLTVDDGIGLLVVDTPHSDGLEQETARFTKHFFSRLGHVNLEVVLGKLRVKRRKQRREQKTQSTTRNKYTHIHTLLYSLISPCSS